jgi:hypothetical protein
MTGGYSSRCPGTGLVLQSFFGVCSIDYLREVDVV